MNALEQPNMSYKLYAEIAADLSEAIDPSLTPEIRFELYNSKIIYLQNLLNQVFKDINTKGQTSFNQEHLINLYKALEISQSFLKATVLEIVNNSLTVMVKNSNTKKGILR